MNRVLAASLALAVLVACKGTTTEPIVAAGRYSLTAVNGAPPPYAAPLGGTVQRQELTLDPAGTFTDRVTRSDGTVLTTTGLYTHYGNALNFSDQAKGAYHGVTDGTTIRISYGGMELTFTRS